MGRQNSILSTANLSIKKRKFQFKCQNIFHGIWHIISIIYMKEQRTQIAKNF